MDATRRSRPGDAPSFVGTVVADALAKALPAGGRIAIAFSGGRDSSALLDAALTAAPAARCDVVAFHVHHGLSAHADAWSRFCAGVCAARGVPLHVRRVRVPRMPRGSVEAAARTARYAALAALAREHTVDAVLLAHHADDQAETMLLQLLRGAGPRGLAAMAVARVDAGILWLRPLLAVPRTTLDAYAAARKLPYVDDDSNVDVRHRRNGLRSGVVPALRSLAPGYPATLVRAAELQADASELLDDLARLDAGADADGDSLDRSRLAQLPARRAANLLRWFLRQRGLPAPPKARLAEMLRQLTTAGRGARVALHHAGARVRVHRGRIVVHPDACVPFAIRWDGEESIALPHGTLRVACTRGAGIAARHLEGSTVTIRSGIPGERLRTASHGARRRVADLLREAGIPSWQRPAIPRVYRGDTLAAVAALGVDAAFVARPGEPAFTLAWQPDRPMT
jgi:tRNA(Ile)-lysidine synthase